MIDDRLNQRLYDAVANNDVMELKKHLKDINEDDLKKAIFRIEYYLIFFFQKLTSDHKKNKKIEYKNFYHLIT